MTQLDAKLDIGMILPLSDANLAKLIVKLVPQLLPVLLAGMDLVPMPVMPPSVTLHA